jgi:hydroxyacylglutathione hydrolase
MTLTPLPALTDNYIWMLHNGHQALVVDPGDAAPVLAALRDLNLQLAAILVTHHHADHTAGIQFLKVATGATVWGPALESIPGIDHPLDDGDTCSALGYHFQVLHVPGHTAGHLAYYAEAGVGELPLVFCGDTLFSGGCGRLFEGTPQQMLASLQRLAALPASTRVCCTHEYTLSNLRFARAVEPDNTELMAYQSTCEGWRAQGVPTLPSSIGLERAINPFLRSHLASVMSAVAQHDAQQATHAGTFAALREWKNTYR